MAATPAVAPASETAANIAHTAPGPNVASTWSATNGANVHAGPVVADSTPKYEVLTIFEFGKTDV